MKDYVRKGIKMVCVGIMSAGLVTTITPNLAVAAEQVGTEVIEYQVQPRVVSYNKTVTNHYDTIGEVPMSITYTEYDSGMNVWMRGSLSFQSAVTSGSGVNATFTGTLYGYE